jgi:hypothetical protein
MDKYLKKHNILDPRNLKYAGVMPKHSDKLNLFDSDQSFGKATN